MSKRYIREVTGVILAGGRSARMGTDKAMLSYHGDPLIQTVAGFMSSLFSRVVLSVRENQSYPFLNLPQIPDRYPESGPLGGITSALAVEQRSVFCVACDMPMLQESVVRFICERPNYDSVIPMWRGKAQVLHALYRPALLEPFHQALQSRNYRITGALKERNVLFLRDDDIAGLDPDGQSFRNVNTPVDYQTLERQ